MAKSDIEDIGWPATPTRTYADGDVIVHAGQASDALYLLEEGSLDVYAVEGDRRIRINRVQPGEVFGEVSFLDHGPASAQVQARGPARVRVLPRSTMQQWRDQDPDLVSSLHADMERDMAARVRRLTELVAPLQVGAWQSTLLGGAAHDLRNPLAVITGTLQTLVAHDAELTPQQRADLLARAGAKAFHLTELLQGMIELSRIELSGHSAERVDALFGDLAASAVQQLDATTNDVHVHDRDVVLRVAPLHVTRILVNLIGNACQHAPSGTAIDVGVQVRGPDVELYVEDRGPGVPDDVKAEVFRPFVTQRRHDGGTGLGLALVAMLAQLSDGSAWVQDRPGGGASFRVSLPRAANRA